MQNTVSFPVSAGPQAVFFPPPGRSEVVWDSGAGANPACFQWLRTRTSLLRQPGRIPSVPDSAFARFKIGDGHVGTDHPAADVPVAVAAKMGTFSTFLVGANAPALLSKGAVETLYGAELPASNEVGCGRPAPRVRFGAVRCVCRGVRVLLKAVVPWVPSVNYGMYDPWWCDGMCGETFFPRTRVAEPVAEALG